MSLRIPYENLPLHMSALDKLDSLKLHLELLERHSQSSGELHTPIEEIQLIRDEVDQLSNELKEELRCNQYHESYRKSIRMQIPRDGSIDPKEKKINECDEETIAWLDDNYGGAVDSTFDSPKRTPLQRFKICTALLKTEIKECRKYGLDTTKMKGLGWARMSVAANSSLTICNMALASLDVDQLLHTCWNLDEFDIFQLAAMPALRGHVLLVFASYVSQQFTFLGQYHIPKDKFHNFLMAIEQNYNDVPYHNKLHAADVVHTMMYFCRTSVFQQHLTELDRLCAFIAAIIHDVGHSGQTNNFHVNSASTLAVRYNDRSVLEQYHLSTAFQLMKETENSFLENLTRKEYKYVRDTVVEMVLGTDMFYHQKQLKKLKQFTSIVTRQDGLQLQMLANHNIPRVRGVLNEKRFLMEIALHLSDISNPSKKLSVSIEWTKRITQEFFAQGDMERELQLPISPGCDRNTHGNIAKQSIAFIDFIVLPIFTEYHSIDPETNTFIQCIKRSRAHWKSKM
eukprot:204367_1